MASRSRLRSLFRFGGRHVDAPAETEIIERVVREHLLALLGPDGKYRLERRTGSVTVFDATMVAHLAATIAARAGEGIRDRTDRSGRARAVPGRHELEPDHTFVSAISALDSLDATAEGPSIERADTIRNEIHLADPRSGDDTGLEHDAELDALLHSIAEVPLPTRARSNFRAAS